MSVIDTVRESVAKWLLRGVLQQYWGAKSLGVEPKDPLERVQMARVYHNRSQKVALTKRQNEWMRRHTNTIGTRYVTNVCRVVTQEYRSRLHLDGVGVAGDVEKANEEAEALLAAYALPAAVQRELYETALVDGVAFLFTDYTPPAEGEPFGSVKYSVERLLVPETFGGDGEGIVPIFEQGDDYPSAFWKVWRAEIPDPRLENGGMITATFRREYHTGYIADYVILPGENKLLPWPDKKTYITLWTWHPNGEQQQENGNAPDARGVPLPPPISAWALPDMRSALDDVVPLQAMLDKVWVNMMMASDWLGSGMVTFMGWIPTADGKPLSSDRSNLLMPVPGDYLYTLRPPSEAQVSVTFPTTVDGLLALESRVISRLSSITGIPQSAFMDSRQVAAEGTLKQQESALLARVGDIQASFSSGVEHWARGLLAQIVAFSGEAQTLEQWDGLRFFPVWRDPQTRNEAEQVGLAVAKNEKLGVPLEMVLSEAGYTKDQIDVIMRSPFAQAIIAEAKARIAAAEEQIQLGSG